MKTKPFIALLMLSTLIFSFNALALCNDGRIGIKVHLSQSTLDAATIQYGDEIPFSQGDFITVLEYSRGTPKRKEILKYGYVSADGAGNYTFHAVSFVHDPPIHISIHLDHEVSWEEGLEGYYRNRTGQDFNLNLIRECDYFNLIVEEPVTSS